VSVKAYDVATIRAAESTVLDDVPEGSLMQRAAAGLATACADRLRSRRGLVTGAHVVLLVGAGNNGGDALWAGSRLADRGARVDALLLGSSTHAEGLAALRASGGRALDVRGAGDPHGAGAELVARAHRLLAAADLVMDGIVGLGGTPGLREPAASLVEALVPAGRGGPEVVAVDLPSGVDADGGTTPAPHVRADLTVTFGGLKPGLLLPPANAAAGEVRLVDIGLRPHLPERPAVDRLTDDDVQRLWPVPGPDDDKYSRGVVGVVAGSSGYTGAAVLAVGGALRSGAGMVRYVGPEHPTEIVRARWPEVVMGAGRVQAWTLGSGVDPDADDDGQVAAVEEALAQGLPAVVDAGALSLVVRPEVRERLGLHVLLTPHAGELARLLSVWTGVEVSRPEVTRDPAGHATRVAELTGAVVLLKGSTTVIVAPDGRARTQADAPPWLATAGAGDVLAGIAGTLLAAGLEPLDAGALAALVHGRAAWRASLSGANAGTGSDLDGDVGPGGPIVADDVITALPPTLAGLLGQPR
jgi:hydroxyethylthiazole kinase-like uncharacterized protein yjeF